MQLYDFTGVGSLSQAYMLSLRAKSPPESEHMNFLHFLLKIYLVSFAVSSSGLKRSCRGPGHHNKHCCGTAFIFQWGYWQHDSELSCHKVNVRTFLLLFCDFLMLAFSQAFCCSQQQNMDLINIFKTVSCIIASSNKVLSIWLLEIFLLREIVALSIYTLMIHVST